MKKLFTIILLVLVTSACASNGGESIFEPVDYNPWKVNGNR